MIHYSCDLCGKTCNDKKFLVPIAATFIEQEAHDIMPVEVNLCSDCRRDFYKVVEKIALKDNLKKLNGVALDVKMRFHKEPK